MGSSAQAWLTVEQIAAHLQVSKETVYRWLDRGKIPAHRVGKQWRFLANEVDEWVLRGEATENLHVNLATKGNSENGEEKGC